MQITSYLSFKSFRQKSEVEVTLVKLEKQLCAILGEIVKLNGQNEAYVKEPQQLPHHILAYCL